MSKTKSAVSQGSQGGAERRRTQRRPIIESFSMFCVVPSKGVHRLQVHDVSDNGIGFDFDTEGEELETFPLKSGEKLTVHLYLNQSLYLPLAVRIVRVEERNQVRRIGAEVLAPPAGAAAKSAEASSHTAFLAFLKMLDALADSAHIQAS